jgi:hypothetical protein
MKERFKGLTLFYTKELENEAYNVANQNIIKKPNLLSNEIDGSNRNERSKSPNPKNNRSKSPQITKMNNFMEKENKDSNVVAQKKFPINPALEKMMQQNQQNFSTFGQTDQVPIDNKNEINRESIFSNVMPSQVTQLGILMDEK